MADEMIVASAKPLDYEHMRATAKAKAPATTVVRLKKYGVRRLWDNEQVVGEVRKNTNYKYRVIACTRDGFRMLHIREFYMHKEDGTWLPARDGIIIPLQSHSFEELVNGVPKLLNPMDELLELLHKGRDIVSKMELSDPDKAVYLLRGVQAHMKSTKPKETDK